MNIKTFSKPASLLAVLLLVISLGACSSSNTGSSSDRLTRAEISAQSTAREISENVNDRVFFQTDRSSLTIASREVLRDQAEWLKQNTQISLIIEGHADERGTREYNLALGARRAGAVRDYLVSLGVQPYRLRTISYGKERPVALCSRATCWAKNRRSVSVIR